MWIVERPFDQMRSCRPIRMKDVATMKMRGAIRAGFMKCHPENEIFGTNMSRLFGRHLRPPSQQAGRRKAVANHQNQKDHDATATTLFSGY
mmetsp:Transcript_3889/g.7971  ORF Transcript_3889/g.7971 Transcript_3889/m.7971 type:complete len:91 (-) Transcript_3889:112-384(-)